MTVESGVSGIQISATINGGEYRQERDNTLTLPSGQILFRGHHSFLDLVIFFADCPQIAVQAM